MYNRISTNLTNDNLQYHTRHRQIELNKSQNRIAAQTRILNLRDDPAGAAHATRHQSYLARLERYNNNIQDSVNNYRIVEGHIQHTVDILQEVREIAIAGANGIYTEEDHAIMGNRVNELLSEIVQTANARNAEGTSLFAGSRTNNLPYRVVEGIISGQNTTGITQVEYIGDINKQQVEVADGQYIELNFPGNEVFWSEVQQIYSQVDARSYVVQADSSINLNGQSIELQEGDNIYQIIARINDSATDMEARLDPVTNSLILEGTTPRQLWMSDEAGTVLQDIGILENSTSRPPQNIAIDARVFGGSLFDSVIRLRDSLFQSNIEDIGGDGLRGIDSSMNNALAQLGSLGAKTSRMEIAHRRTEKEIVDVGDRESRITDIDYTEALTEFAALELTHRAALSITARVIQPTLLDFLR